MSRQKFVSIYGDGWLFFSQRCAIWCQTLAIFRYSARFLGEDFVLANSMHSAANSRKSVDGSQSSKVISLSSFGIFLDIDFMRTPGRLLRTDLPWLDGSRQSIADSGQQARNPSPAPPLMLLRALRRCATPHKLGIQRYKGRTGSQIATLFERAA